MMPCLLGMESSIESSMESSIESSMESSIESSMESGMESGMKTEMTTEMVSGTEAGMKSGIESDMETGMKVEMVSRMEATIESGMESSKEHILTNDSMANDMTSFKTWNTGHEPTSINTMPQENTEHETTSHETTLHETTSHETTSHETISHDSATDPGKLNGIKLTFTSPRKSHHIRVELDIGRHEALVDEMKIEFHSPVELTLLLKAMVTELKKIQIHYIIQQVSRDDWFHILRDQKIFSLVNVNMQYHFLNVRCEIDRFPLAVMKGLGFKEMHES
jgi:hypothetical protein